MADLTLYSVILIMIGFTGLFLNIPLGICFIGIGSAVMIMEYREDKRQNIVLKNEATD